MNTSDSPVEIGKNVKLGDGEPLELCEDEVVENETRAGEENFEINESEETDSAETHKVCNVSEADDESSNNP
jgi:hypothetical protein